MEEILASIRKIISDENVPATESNEVVELTQMVQDDGSVIHVEEVEAVAPPPPPPPPPPPMPDPEPIVLPADALVSDTAATAATSALSSLASTIEIGRLATGSHGGMFLGNGARTLEDMVIELMRPLLKEWLDQNLPAIVDRLVQKEIERIARRAQD
ncbi:MAG: DUF2497 domain-containing protein [Alphaproteobacteria bacterium]|nr:DUF2497 domain-containing protein [Alphaproteobacteria bacterium]MBV8548158.1 DUF2497 domain-containing protein [Alphaproteobacteria bacterium]